MPEAMTSALDAASALARADIVGHVTAFLNNPR
jgi:hypothetical protein